LGDCQTLVAGIGEKLS